MLARKKIGMKQRKKTKKTMKLMNKPNIKR